MKVNGWVALVTGTPWGKAAAPFFPGDPGGSSSLLWRGWGAPHQGNIQGKNFLGGFHLLALQIRAFGLMDEWRWPSLNCPGQSFGERRGTSSQDISLQFPSKKMPALSSTQPQPQSPLGI